MQVLSIPGLEPAVPLTAAAAAVVPPTPRAGLIVPLLHPVVGRTIAAGKPIARGELIVAERPLLAVPAPRALPRELRRLLRRGAKELRVPMTSVMNLHAYTAASPDVRRRVLTFCSYEVHTPVLPPAAPASNDAPPLPRVVNIAMRVSAWWNSQPELQRPHSPTSTGGQDEESEGGAPLLFPEEELTRALCCFALNSHEILEDDDTDDTSCVSVAAHLSEPVRPPPEPEPELKPTCHSTQGVAVAGGPGTTADTLPVPPPDSVSTSGGGGGGTHAMFAMGSRLTHVCGGANSVYHYIDGYGCHRAVRDIHAGEMLTSCYLGARAACERRTRRKYLSEHYLFDCGCEACTIGADRLRQLPCPRCGPQRDARTGLLPPLPTVVAEEEEDEEEEEDRDLDVSSTDDKAKAAAAAAAVNSAGGTNSTGGGVCRIAEGIDACATATDSADDGGSGASASPTALTCKASVPPWLCTACGATFHDAEMNASMAGPAPAPLQLPYPGTLLEWDDQISQAAYALASESDAGKYADHSPADLIRTRRPLLEAVRAVLGAEHWATATCEELLLEAMLEHAAEAAATLVVEHDNDDEEQGKEQQEGQDGQNDVLAPRKADSTAATRKVDRECDCEEIWRLFSHLWDWFELRGLTAVWGLPEDLLQVMVAWPALADYIDGDEERATRLREITEATLDRTIVRH